LCGNHVCEQRRAGRAAERVSDHKVDPSVRSESVIGGKEEESGDERGEWSFGPASAINDKT
jgi:hypothetical protein